MGAYDDNNWVQTLKSLGLTDNEYADAKLLLAEKDAAYRKVMLGDDKDSNKNVILRALGESSLPLGYMESEQYRVPLSSMSALRWCVRHSNVADTQHILWHALKLSHSHHSAYFQESLPLVLQEVR